MISSRSGWVTAQTERQPSSHDERLAIQKRVLDGMDGRLDAGDAAQGGLTVEAGGRDTAETFEYRPP